jgi:hypothetical protein
MSHDVNEALALEKHMIAPERWDLEVPPEVRLHGIEDEIVRYPIGYGRHPDRGWFVISGGQGPFLVWAEWQQEPVKEHGFELSTEVPRYHQALIQTLTRLQNTLQEQDTEP